MSLDINLLVGKTLTDVQSSDDEVVFTVDDGKKYKLMHYQDCCESVKVEDIVGDLKDLVGSPITKAIEETNREDPPAEHSDESYTWTFYHLATVNGYVTIRFFGSSNGYYSESVDFVEC